MQEFSDRAKYRLRIAATFLRDAGVTFPASGNFYGQVLSALEQHAEKDRIKKLVDWVEQFDPHDELGKASPSHNRESAGRRKGRGTLSLSKP